MEGNQQAPPAAQPQQPPSSTATTGYQQQQLGGGGAPYNHLLQQQQQQLQMFWSYQRQEIETANDFKNHSLPLARIKKIMKADEDVRMISAEAPILFAKACELFILELTIRSWLHAEENKRRTLQKNDIAAAITRTDIFDFLVDIVPRDEIKDEGVGVGVGVGGVAGMGMVGGMMGVGVAPTGVGVGVGVGPTASGVPYYYPPMGQPAPPGVMIGRPAMDPTAAGMYGGGGGAAAGPPSTAWQSVWQGGPHGGDDGSYASAGPGPGPAAGNGGQANLDAQRFSEELKDW